MRFVGCRYDRLWPGPSKANDRSLDPLCASPPRAVCTQRQAAAAAECEIESEVEPVLARPRRIRWARLRKHVFDIDMQQCPNCGAGDRKIIAAILERPVIEDGLTHLGQDPQPPPRGRAREAGQDFAA
jgi:hypothetical protein